MIASLRGLAVLAAIAGVLAIVLVIDTTRSHAVGDRGLLVLASPITELRLARTGEPTVRLIRRGEAWRWAQPDVPADPRAVDAMVSALRGGRWHRTGDRELAGAARATLDVVAGRTTTITICGPLAGAGQTWLAIGDRAYLVDDWVAGALAPASLDLRIRHPFETARSPFDVDLGHATLRIEGQPRHVTSPEPLWPSPAALAALDDALAAIELVSLDPPPPYAGPITIRAAGGSLTGGAPCGEGRVHVAGALGEGCVAARPWEAMVVAARALSTPGPAVGDPRPLPFTPTKLVLGDGATIDRTRRPQLDGRDADPDRVAELVAALTEPAALVPLPQGKPKATIVATAAGTEITLDVHDRVVARRGEPFALAPTPEGWAAITRPSAAYRDPTRWLEEPTTIAQIAIDGVVHARGAVLGEWTHTKDPVLLEALAQTIAVVRAPTATAPVAIEHRVEVVIAPPTGEGVTHHLEVGRLGPTGCPGRADGAPVVLPLPLCTAVAAASR